MGIIFYLISYKANLKIDALLYPEILLDSALKNNNLDVNEKKLL